jgi:hypothetical protein
MDHKLRFFFYLAALICFLLAAFGTDLGRMGRPGMASRLSLLPLGLALFIIPTLWDTAEAAF